MKLMLKTIVLLLFCLLLLTACSNTATSVESETLGIYILPDPVLDSDISVEEALSMRRLRFFTVQYLAE